MTPPLMQQVQSCILNSILNINPCVYTNKFKNVLTKIAGVKKKL